jgi:hypothetical protein
MMIKKTQIIIKKQMNSGSQPNQKESTQEKWFTWIKTTSLRHNPITFRDHLVVFQVTKTPTMALSANLTSKMMDQERTEA